MIISKMTILVLVITILLMRTSAMYKHGCFDGYYEAQGCQPCHSSCKTCSGPYSCDTCEDYMFLHQDPIHVEGIHPEGTYGRLCNKCPEGQYYDNTGEICRSCDDKCVSDCRYQSLCFQCENDQAYDLENLKCIDSTNCVSPKHLLSNPQYTLTTICRTLDYFINPFSQESIELGTQRFPYRSFLSLSSEILTLHSHSNSTLTIHTTDTYLHSSTLFLLNITKVIIKAYPDYSKFHQDQAYTRFLKLFLHLRLIVCNNNTYSRRCFL